MEVTFDATGKIADSEIGAIDYAVVKELDGKMKVWSWGRSMNVAQVEITKASGGEFVISPDVNGEVIKRTTELAWSLFLVQ